MLQQSLRQAAHACASSFSRVGWQFEARAGHVGVVALRTLSNSAASLATDIVVPSMGDSITEGSISSILKQAKEAVDEDEPVIQIETDKVRRKACAAVLHL